MRKSAAVPIMLTSSLALALTGCSSDSQETQNQPVPIQSGQAQPVAQGSYQGVCVDPNTGQRVDDDICDDDDGSGSGGAGLLWYYFLLNRPYPAVGSSVTNNYYSGTDYVRSVPNGSTYVSGGAPREGGTVSASTLSSAASSSTGRVVSKSSSGALTKSAPGAGLSSGGSGSAAGSGSGGSGTSASGGAGTSKGSSTTVRGGMGSGGSKASS